MRRSIARFVRQLSRPWRRLSTRLGRRSAGPAATDLAPSPGVAAFLAGESMRQIAYFVGSADPGIIDPNDDWPSAVADAHGVNREYMRRLQARIAELEQDLAQAPDGDA